MPISGTTETAKLLVVPLAPYSSRGSPRRTSRPFGFGAAPGLTCEACGGRAARWSHHRIKERMT